MEAVVVEVELLIEFGCLELVVVFAKLFEEGLSDDEISGLIPVGDRALSVHIIKVFLVPEKLKFV